jgi:hypothetical protein
MPPAFDHHIHSYGYSLMAHHYLTRLHKATSSHPLTRAQLQQLDRFPSYVGGFASQNLGGWAEVLDMPWLAQFKNIAIVLRPVAAVEFHYHCEYGIERGRIKALGELLDEAYVKPCLNWEHHLPGKPDAYDLIPF